MRLEDGRFSNGRYEGAAVVVTDLSLPAHVYDLANEIMNRAVRIGAVLRRRHRCEFAVMLGRVDIRLYSARNLVAALRRVLIKSRIGEKVALWVKPTVVVLGKLIGWSDGNGQRVIVEGQTVFVHHDQRQGPKEPRRIMVSVPKLREVAPYDERLLRAA